ncbi:MAG: hypothetical protein WC661_10105 [Opitutaceae bacterium]|jgi:sialate O-acetylesterase
MSHLSPSPRRLAALSGWLLLFPLFAVSDASAKVELPPVLDSHMVLQRGMPVPVWGTAEPGETVSVSFRGQTKTTAAADTGKWMVKLDPLQPGEPGELTVTGKNTITLKDVVVGEVWVGSGQSNLDSPIQMYEKDDPVLKEAAAKTHPDVRVFRSGKSSLKWSRWDPKRTRSFSAQLFYYGLKLQEELGVPVGLIQAAVAGSPSGHWIDADSFRSDPVIQKAAALSNAKEPLESRMKGYEAALKQWQEKTAAAKAAGTPESQWPKAPSKPGPYGQQATGDFYDQFVRPVMPFAIRGVLWDQGEGGSTGGIDQVSLMSGLIRAWRKNWGQGDFPWLYVKKPSGGGCALNPDNPVNRGAKPFESLPKTPPATDYFAGKHQESYRIAQNPNTFLVTTTDLAGGVHPANKSGYGTRDCLVAMGAVYGKAVEYYGPVYESAKQEGGTLRISFTHTGKGLTTPAGQPLQGFLIAGEDKKFHWADARIDGKTVVLSSPQVPRPVAARYAWTWPLAWANLFNADGLPAFSFRTDSQ